jgi:resuscitation-promoting factor RpfB
VRRSFQISLFALVLVGLVGGLVAYVSAQKTVTLTVDGQSRAVDTYAATVAEVLEDEGVSAGEHDVVLPGVDQTVSDGDTVVLNRARPLQLTVDGVAREVFTTALSVDEALQQLGFRDDELVLSASRNERLPLGGMALSITTPKTVTLVADGEERVVSTTAATAGDLLAEHGIALRELDELSLYPEQVLLDQMRLQVFRVTEKQESVTKAIDFERIESEDATAFEGERTVVQQGKAGEQVTTYRVVFVDGKESRREELDTQVTVEPVTEKVTVGTKERPAAPSAPSVAGGGVWDRLAQCESGGNWSINTGNGYYGGLQFNLGTWQGYGGQGYPHENSRDQQIAIAQKLVDASGGSYGAWPHCSAKLGLP